LADLNLCEISIVRVPGSHSRGRLDFISIFNRVADALLNRYTDFSLALDSVHPGCVRGLARCRRENPAPRRSALATGGRESREIPGSDANGWHTAECPRGFSCAPPGHSSRTSGNAIRSVKTYLLRRSWTYLAPRRAPRNDRALVHCFLIL
jgi:hypothetical protein